MADNWGFVAAAYLLAAGVLGGYWRRLVRRERELRHRRHREPAAPGSRPAVP